MSDTVVAPRGKLMPPTKTILVPPLDTRNDETIFFHKIFSENAIDAEVLTTLTEDDLKEIGIRRLGDRRKLQLSITSLAKGDEASAAAAASTPATDTFTDAPATSTPMTGTGTRDAPSTSTSMTGTGTRDAPSTSTPMTGTGTRYTPSTSKWPGSDRNLQLTCPDDYNIEDILQKHKDGTALLRELTGDGIVLDGPRQKLVQICVAFLTDKVDSLKPSAEQKETLAKAIVRQFPKLKDRMPGSMGHEGFYHKGDGFIEYRLKTVRNSLKRSSLSTYGNDRVASKKPSTVPPTESPAATPTADTLEKIEWIRYHPPTRDNSSKIRDYMKDTFLYRRHIIETQNPTITDTLASYPRFRDMPELINLEFEGLHKDQGSNLFLKWKHQYRPQIIGVAKRVGVLVEKEDDAISDLDVLELLARLLPPTKKKGTKGPNKADAVTFLVQRSVVGTDVELFAQKKEPIYSQPYLLALCNGGNPVEHFIIVDNMTIPVGKDSLESFDKLYKAFFVFNVSYPHGLETFYNFCDAIVYGTIKSSDVKPIVRAKYSQMMKISSEL